MEIMQNIADKPRPRNFDDLPLFLSVAEAAAVLGIGKNTAYDMVRCGRLASVRLGHQIRVPKAALKNI